MENSLEKNKDLTFRPPIVVIMGHIDHGKTKLLDAIRSTNIAERESGGITQHIGAYEIEAKISNPEFSGRKITFIDTPGHEAFSRMRARGAKIGDIAVLVVAADEGIKPQTLEALKHIQSAKIPFIVAINKIDKPESNPEKIKQQFAENGVFLEGYGGHVPFVLVSAKEKKNLEELLEMILLVADMEELKADPKGPAQGVIMEVKMDSRRGVTVSALILSGILKTGDSIAASSVIGSVKIMENCLGQQIKEATFSSPILIVGFKELPQAGDEFIAGDVDLAAICGKADAVLEKISRNCSILENDDSVINAIIKADYAGSLEVLENMIDNFEFSGKKIRIISSSIGDVSSSDIQNAQASNAWIFGFRIKVPKDLEATARCCCIRIFIFDVIYELEKFLKEEIGKIFGDSEKKEESECSILACFSRRKSEQVIGGKIIKGRLARGNVFQLIRGEEKIGQGKISNIQVFKKDVSEAVEGKEAGFCVDCETEIKPGDKLVLNN